MSIYEELRTIFEYDENDDINHILSKLENTKFTLLTTSDKLVNQAAKVDDIDFILSTKRDWYY